MLLACILTCIEVFIKLCEALGFLGHIDESDIFFQERNQYCVWIWGGGSHILGRGAEGLRNGTHILAEGKVELPQIYTQRVKFCFSN